MISGFWGICRRNVRRREMCGFIPLIQASRLDGFIALVNSKPLVQVYLDLKIRSSQLHLVTFITHLLKITKQQKSPIIPFIHSKVGTTIE
jgi:hypothetical protein